MAYGSHLLSRWPGGHFFSVFDEQLGTVVELVVLARAALFVQKDDAGVPVDDDLVVVLVDRLELFEADLAAEARLELRLLGLHTGRDTADVERPHRELRARLADRLRRDDTHRFANVDEVAAGQVATVATATDAPQSLAGEDRADLDPLDARLFDLTHARLVEQLTLVADDLVRSRSVHGLERGAAENTVAEALDDLTRFHERFDLETLDRAAVLLGDDGFLRHVDQTPGEIPGVGRLERGVGQPLARAVGGDEVLLDGQPLAEVGGDRLVDDLTGRLGHQAAHPGELAHLLT